MAYDEGLAQRVRELLDEFEVPELVEKKMFGGIAFMLRGNLACGVLKKELIVRVGPAGYKEAIQRPHAKLFDVSGKPMKGWVMVRPGGYESDAALKDWVQQGVTFALSLPAK